MARSYWPFYYAHWGSGSQKANEEQMLLKKNLQFAPKHTLDKSNDDFQKLSTVQNLKDESFLVSYCVTDTVSQSEPKRAKMNQNESE